METFWQLFKAYHKRVWLRALSDTRAILGINKTTFWIAATTIISWLALWLLFKWTWTELSGEIIPVLAVLIATIRNLPKFSGYTRFHCWRTTSVL
jgi:hypothetical protein